MTERVDKINELIKHELGQIILKEIDFPADCFVTINNVQVSGDCRKAKVFIKILPTDEQDAILKILKKALPHLHQVLYKSLSLHHTPELYFIIDQSAKKEERINQLLDEISQDI